jgi:hypothetical protein
LIEDIMSKIEVKPSDNLFEELGKNSLDYTQAIAELIDNSIGSMLGSECNVEIEVRGDWSGKGKKLCLITSS